MKTYCNFILKFILCTSVLCLLYVYIENKIKIINLKKVQIGKYLQIENKKNKSK